MNAALVFAAAAALAGAALWYMVRVPGESWRGPFTALDAEEEALAARLRRHVAEAAGAERNVPRRRDALEAAARYIETELASHGYAVRAEPYDSGAGTVRNLEAVLAGREPRSIVVGAHYDSVEGAVGANDNGSGVAALLELARMLRTSEPRLTLRFAFFANEEPPWFATAAMGSRVYADALVARAVPVAAMFSLETIGYYSEAPGSQRYPFPLGLFYPDRGDFVAFVANLGSRALLHRALAAFRREARFPSEGVAAPALVPGVDWSDQRSFWRHRIPALMITDTAPYRYPHYHLPSDTPDKVDYARLARLTVGLARMLRALDAEL